MVALLALVVALLAALRAPSSLAARGGAAPRRGASTAARPYGPPDLEEVCADGVCHRFGKLSAPLDHDDPSQGDWDLTYFVNSDFWDPLANPHAPVFINMGYGSTTVGGWTASALRQVDL
jgi:hypothetical protein